MNQPFATARKRQATSNSTLVVSRAVVAPEDDFYVWRWHTVSRATIAETAGNAAGLVSLAAYICAALFLASLGTIGATFAVAVTLGLALLIHADGRES